MIFSKKPLALPEHSQALKGRDTPLPIPKAHFIFHRPLDERQEHHETALFGMGCFWGVERIFWQLNGVFNSSVGYAGGFTPNATYEEVCTGLTGHNEVVQIIFDPTLISYDTLLKTFWENHDPTQGMRQGNDRGTQYRSGIYCYSDAQKQAALASKAIYQEKLTQAGYGAITTEIIDAPPYYYAEEYHQQYLAKNPNGYCGIGGDRCALPHGNWCIVDDKLDSPHNISG